MKAPLSESVEPTTIDPTAINFGSNKTPHEYDDFLLAVMTDLDAWCAKLGAAGPLDDRRLVLRAWVDAAGGWHDAAAVSLPVALPIGLALATLKAHARALRLEVRDDPDDPALMRWLRGAPTDMEASP